MRAKAPEVSGREKVVIFRAQFYSVLRIPFYLFDAVMAASLFFSF